MKCGCKIIKVRGKKLRGIDAFYTTTGIQFCPLHTAAEEFKNTLIAVYDQISSFNKVHGHNYFPGTLKLIEKTIAKAEKK